MSEPPHPLSVAGETALVTAATRGIGREYALALARAGANVAVGCRDIAAGESLAQELRERSVRATAVVMDLSSLASIAPAVAAAEDALGAISILVNNAGHGVPAPALDAQATDFKALSIST